MLPWKQYEKIMSPIGTLPRRAPEIRMTCFGMGQTLGTRPIVWLIMVDSNSRNDQMCELGPMVAKCCQDHGNDAKKIALEMQLCKVLVTSINLNLR